MIPRTFPSSRASNGSTQMIVYFLPSVSGLTRWVDYIPVKFTTVATAATENTYNQNGYIPVVSISSIAGATPFKEYVPVFLDSSAADAEVWKVNITGFIPVGTAGIGGAALYMDFAATTTLDPRVTFSRTTNATLTNSAGLVANAPMNLLTFSEQFDNAAWTKANVTATANSVVAPNGTTTAETLTSTNASASNLGVFQSVTTSTGQTLSIYAKAGTSNFVGITNSGGSGGAWANFNLSTGAVASSASCTASIVAVGNGWFRCVLANTTATGSNFFTVGGKDADPGASPWSSGTQAIGNTIFIWGAQLELGSVASPYNPTTVKNLLGFTEHFDNAAWTKSNASISATKVDDIYGQPFAQKLVETTANSTHFTRQAISPIANGVYTFSVYAKAAERSFIILQPFNDVRYAFFNLATGVVGSVNGSPLSTSIQSVGDGWYRCSITAASSGTTGDSIIYVSNANGTTSYTGDGTSGIYIFGAQLSDSASVDPYVYQPVAAPSSVAYYGPRFDYDPVTLAPKGLLIEEQRTNLLLQSQTFKVTPWSSYLSTTVANAAVAPDGTTTATSMIVTGQYGNISQSVTVSASTTYTYSCYVRVPTGSTALIMQSFDGTSYTNVSLNVGSTWTRVTRTVTTGAVAATLTLQIIDNSASGWVGVQIWGAQLEAGAFATSYIPTVASQVTRAADSASMIGNNFARWYNQTDGTIFSDHKLSNTSSAYGVIQLTGGGAGGTQNFAQVYAVSSAYSIRLRVGGSNTISSTFGTTSTTTDGSVAFAYETGILQAYAANGSSIAAGSSAMPLCDTLEIGAYSTFRLNGHIARIAYYNRRLSNTELQGITS